MKRPVGTHPIYWRTLRTAPPADWEVMEVGQMSDCFKGKLPAALLDKPTPTSVPYLLIDGLVNGSSMHTEDTSVPRINEDDIILVADGSRSGLALRGVSGALGSTLLCYRAKQGINQDFLFYLLESLYPYTNTATIGGAVPHLDKRLLDSMRLAVPPLPEQKAIADVLDACDAARSAIEAKLAAAQRLKTALMQQLFTRGIPGRHKKFTKTKWIHAPAKWDVLPLREMAEIVSGFTMGRDLSGNELVSLPYLTVINVQEGRLDLSCIEPVAVKASEVEDLLLRLDDVLMTEGGDRDKLGRGCIWRGELEKCVFQNHIFRIRFKPDTYLPELFHFLLQSWQAKNYFYAHAKQTSNLCTINKRELRRFPVPKPQPDEQNEMLALLKTAEANIQAIGAELNSLQRLKTSLLQNLLTGKVRIKMED